MTLMCRKATSLGEGLVKLCCECQSLEKKKALMNRAENQNAR